MQIHLNKGQWVSIQQLMGYLKGELAAIESLKAEYNAATDQRHRALIEWVDTLHQIIPDKPPRV